MSNNHHSEEWFPPGEAPNDTQMQHIRSQSSSIPTARQDSEATTAADNSRNVSIHRRFGSSATMIGGSGDMSHGRVANRQHTNTDSVAKSSRFGSETLGGIDSHRQQTAAQSSRPDLGTANGNRSQQRDTEDEPKSEADDQPHEEQDQRVKWWQHKCSSRCRHKRWEIANREPLFGDVRYRVVQGTTNGLIHLMNPTEAQYQGMPAEPGSKDIVLNKNFPVGTTYLWNSRDSRKGRHVLALPKNAKNPQGIAPTNRPRLVLIGIGNMFDKDIFIKGVSCWGMFVFLAGSICWIFTSGFSLAPLIDPKHAPEFYLEIVGTSLGLGGSLIFLFGALLLLLEVFSDANSTCQEWIATLGESVVDPESGRILKWKPKVHACVRKEPPYDTGYYWYEIGFWAVAIQITGSLLFFVANVCRFFPIAKILSTTETINSVWMVKLAACILFVISGILNTWETQSSPFKLRPDLIGWWVGIFKILGAVAFVICSIYGWRNEKEKDESVAEQQAIQAAVHALWGSCCFFIATVLLWYEVAQSFPVVYGTAKDSQADQVDEGQEMEDRRRSAGQNSQRSADVQMSGALDANHDANGSAQPAQRVVSQQGSNGDEEADKEEEGHEEHA